MDEPLRILIVEDEAMIAMMIEDMLIDAGYVVAGIAATCAEALDLIAQSPCDAAILDVNLAGEKSWPVADALAARGIGFAFASGGQEARPAPHDTAPTLDKPFQFNRLCNVLTNICERK